VSFEAAIETAGLRKAFGKTVAVAGLDLQVRPGEIFGLIGPDGAGKTTTFRLLLGLLQPDAGSARVLGFDSRRERDRVRRSTGYVPQHFALYDELTVLENLRFAAEIRDLPRAEYEVRTAELLRVSGLAAFDGRRARDLSGGMKRKLSLIATLLGRPRLLLLDEPTSGMDPLSRRDFWRLLYDLSVEGATLLVSTPYLDEAERCRRVALMTGGQLAAVDTPAGLVEQLNQVIVRLECPDRTAARRHLQQCSGILRLERSSDSLRVALAAGTAPDAPARWLAEAGVALATWEQVSPNLSDVFSALLDTPRGAE